MVNDACVTQNLQIFKPEAATLDILADVYAEPEWMREARNKAWELYQQTPFPAHTEEAWRRTRIKDKYPWDSLRVVIAPLTLEGLDDLPLCWHSNLAPEDQVSGTLVHYNGTRSYMALRRDDIARGVVFEDLHEALQTHGDLIRRYWMQGRTARPDFNKFTALHGALWHGGTFVHVPAGVRVQRPLQSLVSCDGDTGTSLHHTLVIAEKGSHVTLIQDRVSQEAQPELNAEVVEIYAEAGAWVRYVSLHHWGAQRYSVSVQDAELQQDANFVWVNGSLGGKMSKDFMVSTLNGSGGRAIMQSFAFATGKQHIDQSTYQHHRAPDTYSDLLFRNVLRDSARTVFYGMVRAEPEATNMEGYQSNNNLLLDDAWANSIPGLEILCDDVKCSHGSTLSYMDPEQLFYLRSRGMPKEEAQRLLVQGFIHPIVERVPLAHLRERLGAEIMERFWAV